MQWACNGWGLTLVPTLLIRAHYSHVAIRNWTLHEREMSSIWDKSSSVKGLTYIVANVWYFVLSTAYLCTLINIHCGTDIQCTTPQKEANDVPFPFPSVLPTCASIFPFCFYQIDTHSSSQCLPLRPYCFPLLLLFLPFMSSSWLRAVATNKNDM